MSRKYNMGTMNISVRADSWLAPNQWETALLCGDVSHWLAASLESDLSVSSQMRVTFYVVRGTCRLYAVPMITGLRFHLLYLNASSFFISPLLDECDLNPDYCQNGGICNFGSNGASCTCIQPWVGEFCELRGGMIGCIMGNILLGPFY